MIHERIFYIQFTFIYAYICIIIYYKFIIHLMSMFFPIFESWTLLSSITHEFLRLESASGISQLARRAMPATAVVCV